MRLVINGETFDFDNTRRPMSEALAIEKEWNRRYAEWEAELTAGSAEAMAVLVWVVYRREGRDVPLADILSGKVDFDYNELLRSLNTAAAEDEEEDPTSGAAPRTVPDGTAMTPSGTRASSRKSSA